MQSNRGFTLVELAIVVVIVGFVIGGISHGAPLVASAETRRVIGDYRAIHSGIQAYAEANRGLPGDDPRASTRFPVSSGNGNGVIEGRWDSQRPDDESALVWQHLNAAGYFLGRFDPAAGPSDLPRLQPTDSFGRRMGIQSINGTDVSPIRGLRGVMAICTAGMPAATARSVDQAVDDGNPATGSFLAAAVDAVATGDAVPVTAYRDGELLTLCQSF